MDEPYQYKLADPTQTKRLEELTDRNNPTALEGEIALTRLLIERQVNLGNDSLAKQLIATVGKLSQTVEAAKFRRGELLSRMAVLSIAQNIVQVFATQIANRFPGWEDTLNVVKNEILLTVEQTKNPETEGRPPGEPDYMK